MNSIQKFTRIGQDVIGVLMGPRTLEGIDPALVRRIVHDNAKELYRLAEVA